MNVERIFRLAVGLLAVLGAVLAVLGALSGSGAIVGLGLAVGVAGAVLYWASPRFWNWYWGWLESVQRGETEPTTTRRAVLVVLFVAVGTTVFVGLWWIAAFAGVVTDGALAGNLLSVVTVAGGVAPGVVFGGGFFAVVRVLQSRDASLEIVEGSNVLQLIFATVLCTLGAYCLLLFRHPPAAVALAGAYLASFVVGAAVFATRTADT